jgi:hypothetical protein
VPEEARRIDCAGRFKLNGIGRAVVIEKGRRVSTGKDLIRLNPLEYIICFVLIWTRPYGRGEGNSVRIPICQIIWSTRNGPQCEVLLLTDRDDLNSQVNSYSSAPDALKSTTEEHLTNKFKYIVVALVTLSE